MTRTQHAARPSDRLWGTIRIWTILFLISSAAAIAAVGFRIWLLGSLPVDFYMDEMSSIPEGVPWAEVEVFTALGGSLAYVVTYIVSAILVLIWYLRSVRNAHALSIGVETSPKWAIWWFIIPLVSWWKPYSMTSELWRSSLAPDRWKGLPDPALLRWWWGSVLVGGIAFAVGNALSRSAVTAGQLIIADSVSIGGYAAHMAAGVLFLGIAGPVSRRQTALISAGRVAPQASNPAWAD
jgi:hypothetical protein